MRHYIQMTAYFVKRVKLFPMPYQVEEDESMVIGPRHDAVVNLLLPLINWDEQAVDDLDTLTNLVKVHTKQLIDGKVS